MNYLVWAILALLAYSMVAPTMKVAVGEIPSPVVAFVANGILALTALGVAVWSGHEVSSYVTHPKAPYMYAGGAFLAVGILSYYRSLSLGPVSVVVPVFGLFIVISSLVSVVALDETLTARKALGVGLAVVAIWLVAFE
ncbi:MAG TPA: EamA family transporter [Natrialbaceae archaeon]|nr:EamA family transporter [Natrialbaceae archaeon]